MSTHTKEPWQYSEEHEPHVRTGAGRSTIIIINRGDLKERQATGKRIVSCVNALAGVADPESAIKEARDALKEATELLSHPDDLSSISWSYLQERVMKMRRALALLGGGE